MNLRDPRWLGQVLISQEHGTNSGKSAEDDIQTFSAVAVHTEDSPVKTQSPSWRYYRVLPDQAAGAFCLQYAGKDRRGFPMAVCTDVNTRLDASTTLRSEWKIIHKSAERSSNSYRQPHPLVVKRSSRLADEVTIDQTRRPFGDPPT